jgi:mannose-6-phosphate isomerase-like protein (cupin superfamily)
VLRQRDEVYIVVAGSAHYKVGDMITAVGPGDLLFAVGDGIAVAMVR